MSQANFIPAGPIHRLLNEHLQAIQREREHVESGHMILAERIWPHRKPKNCTRSIFRIMGQKFITFDLADYILCQLNEVCLWHTDPELSEAYTNARLTPIPSGDKKAYYREWRRRQREAAA